MLQKQAEGRIQIAILRIGKEEPEANIYMQRDLEMSIKNHFLVT